MPKLRLLLADDHTLVRQGLRKILEERPDWEVVEEVGDGREAVRAAVEQKPDVAIVDAAMPLLNGIDATQQIVKRVPGTRVLMLSMHSDEAYLTRALQAGATGYILKDSAGKDLLKGVEAVSTGKPFFSPAIERLMLDDYVRRGTRAVCGQAWRHFVNAEGRVARAGFRVGLLVGVAIMLVVWVRAGAAYSERQAAMRDDAAEIASRYLQAQEALSTIRTMALLSSVRVRDALLDQQSVDVFEDRRQIAAAHRLVRLLLEDYQPMGGEASVRASLDRLVSEIDQLHAASLTVLNEGRHSQAAIRDVLNRRIAPRRDAVLELADAIQAANRSAFIARQAAAIDGHTAGDLQDREELRVALVIGLIALLLAFVYAGSLESKLKTRP